MAAKRARRHAALHHHAHRNRGRPGANVSVTDDIPANTTFASFVSIPAGATSAFTPAPGGNNDKGSITVTGITVPASSSRTVVFDVTVINGHARAR